MLKQYISRTFLFILIAGVFIELLVRPGFASPPLSGEINSVQVAESVTGSKYLPLTMNFSPSNTVFGVEMQQINSDNGLGEVVTAAPSWVRRNALYWSDAEPAEGTYTWSNLTDLEQEMINASQDGLNLVLIVRSTPPWAQELDGYYCGRIRMDKLAAFGNFMYEAVKRYSAPPFNVKYWQIWNEPDADPSHPSIQPDNIYGCWGDEHDPYFGGEYFADVLEAIYARIKQANSAVQVLTGGLLLPCNVELPAVCNSNQSKYLEGILRHHGVNDGGNYFDVVAYHSYDYYYQRFGEYGNTAWGTRWTDEGPSLAAKARYLRKTLEKYGFGNKPMMTTEVTVLCGSTGNEGYCQDNTFQTTKAYYVAQNFATALASGLKANIWYSLSANWRGTSLLDSSSLEPLPAYTVFKVAREKLQYARLARVITEYPGINGFDFFDSNGHVWVLWSRAADGSGHPTTVEVVLPGTPSTVWDVFGDQIYPNETSLSVSIMPLYVEWR